MNLSTLEGHLQLLSFTIMTFVLFANIIATHLGVKCMLNSLPLFLISTGIRINVNFERQVTESVAPSQYAARCLGFSFMAMYAVMGLIVAYIHTKHMAVFRERYEVVKKKEMPYLKHVHTMMQSQRASALDV